MTRFESVWMLTDRSVLTQKARSEREFKYKYKNKNKRTCVRARVRLGLDIGRVKVFEQAVHVRFGIRG